MGTTLADYGPFAPVVGYGVAIIAAGGALAFAWAGRLRKWRPPEEDLPGAGRGGILLICGVGMVVLWFVANPLTAPWILGVSVLLALICLACLVTYSGQLGANTYTQVVAISSTETSTRKILGGEKLLPEAEKIRLKNGITIQDLLEGADYDPDKLWSRESRRRVKTRILVLFVVTLVLGTWSLTGISFATQVLLTKKPASSVIDSKDAPGIKP